MWRITNAGTGTKGSCSLISNVGWSSESWSRSRAEILSLWCVLLGGLIMRENSLQDSKPIAHKVWTLFKNVCTTQKQFHTVVSGVCVQICLQTSNTEQNKQN